MLVRSAWHALLRGQVFGERFRSAQAQHLSLPGGPCNAVLWKTRHASYSPVDTQLFLFTLSPLSSKMKDVSRLMRKQ